MLKYTEEEKQEVVEYFLWQSLEDTEVKFAQKVYAESVVGHTHAVWDIHASDGRWWVITNPRNLYSQDQFPNMDLALTFHMGLCVRIPRNDVTQAEVTRVRPFTAVLQSVADCDVALGQANDSGAFRAIGVRCRENLLAFVHAAQDACQWPEQDRPQRSNFKGWIDWIFDTFLGGADNRERRGLIKTTMKETWDYVNWLTHSQSGKWLDAEIATNAVSHANRHGDVDLRAVPAGRARSVPRLRVPSPLSRRRYEPRKPRNDFRTACVFRVWMVRRAVASRRENERGIGPVHHK